jgi:GNAT superfamily N-acetyltransferase
MTSCHHHPREKIGHIVIEISPATHGDVEAIALLMDDLDRFYGATDIEPPRERVTQIAAALFEDPRAAYALLAWKGEQLVGMAAYSFLWPAAGVTRSLYLKEIYVTESARRKGTGVALMRQLCRIAIEHACSRVEWTTDKGNLVGEAFYERLGAPQNQEKIFYRLEDEDIRRIAASCSHDPS